MSAQYGGYHTRKEQSVAFVCNSIETVVAFLAFVTIFGTLVLASLGLVYLLVGGLLNIFGVFVPGISVR